MADPTGIPDAQDAAPYTVLGPLRAKEHLAALEGHLRGLKLDTTLSDTSILVADPDRPDVETRIVCRERPSYGDRFWFWDAWGAPLAEVDQVTDAVVAVRGLLAKPFVVATP